jgi:hypothetical protein
LLPARTFDPDAVRALIRTAEMGDDRCLPALRQFLRENPSVRRSFDLSAIQRRALIEKMYPTRLYSRELLQAQADEVLASVLGPDPTPVERLLAERVAVGWLQVQDADVQVSLANGLVPALELKRADSAYRRYLAALRALAAFRRLPRPAMQVNIGEQQVNVSG